MINHRYIPLYDLKDLKQFLFKLCQISKDFYEHFKTDLKFNILNLRIKCSTKACLDLFKNN